MSHRLRPGQTRQHPDTGERLTLRRNIITTFGEGETWEWETAMGDRLPLWPEDYPDDY